jgi:molecular chaperone GrpE
VKPRRDDAARPQTPEPAAAPAPDPGGVGPAGAEAANGEAAGQEALAELERLRAREDELLRAVAEQQNVMRRRKQDMEASIRHAEESLVRDLLPVLDDLDRALVAMEGPGGAPIREGVVLVRDHLARILTGRGLEAIRPEGEPFDPELHDALAQRPSDAAPGTVLEVVQPGYRYRDRVLRHAKVVVAGPAAGASAPREDPA